MTAEVKSHVFLFFLSHYKDILPKLCGCCNPDFFLLSSTELFLSITWCGNSLSVFSKIRWLFHWTRKQILTGANKSAVIFTNTNYDKILWTELSFTTTSTLWQPSEVDMSLRSDVIFKRGGVWGQAEGYELTDGWHGNKSPGRLCKLLLTDKICGLTAWIILTHRWDERQNTVLMFCDYPAAIRTICCVSVIIVV